MASEKKMPIKLDSAIMKKITSFVSKGRILNEYKPLTPVIDDTSINEPSANKNATGITASIKEEEKASMHFLTPPKPFFIASIRIDARKK